MFFLFAKNYLPSPKEESIFITYKILKQHATQRDWGLGFTRGSPSLSDASRTGERRLSFSSGFLLISPLTAPILTRPAQPSPAQPSPAQEHWWNSKIFWLQKSCHHQHRIESRQDWSWAASEQEHNQWSDAGRNSESPKPKTGWILHKRKCIQYTHTLLGHGVDFYLLLPGYGLNIDLICSQPEHLPCIFLRTLLSFQSQMSPSLRSLPWSPFYGTEKSRSTHPSVFSIALICFCFLWFSLKNLKNQNQGRFFKGYLVWRQEELSGNGLNFTPRFG